MKKELSRSIIVSLFSISLLLSACSPAKSQGSETGKSKASTTTHAISSDYPHYKDQAALTQTADIIIQGKILDSKVEVLTEEAVISSSDDPKVNPYKDKSTREAAKQFVYTVYSVSVEKVYKGGLKAGEVTQIKIPGGILDDKRYEVEDTDLSLEKDERLIMFLSASKEGPASLLNPVQALYKKPLDDGKKATSRDNINHIILDLAELDKLAD